MFDAIDYLRKHGRNPRTTIRGDAFRATFAGLPSEFTAHGLEDALKPQAALGAARIQVLEATTVSGRRFRYQIEDYPFGPDTTPEQADSLARKIVHDKYREGMGTEEEIIDEVRSS